MCAGKVSYPSPGAALKARKGLERKGRKKNHKGLSPYRCPNCSQYHLGTAPTTSKQELRTLKKRFARAHPEEWHGPR